jgi:hypothetical protein
VNGGTVAARTARAMHEPTGVPAKGGATLAVVTRPLDAKVTEMFAIPLCPVLAAQARTAPWTPRMALSTSPRPGVSGPPPAGALEEPDEGAELLAGRVCVSHERRQLKSPRHRAAHERPAGAELTLLLAALLFDGALGVELDEDELRELRELRSARLLGSLPDGAVPLGCVVPAGPAAFAPFAPLFGAVPAFCAPFGPLFAALPLLPCPLFCPLFGAFAVFGPLPSLPTCVCG